MNPPALVVRREVERDSSNELEPGPSDGQQSRRWWPLLEAFQHIERAQNCGRPRRADSCLGGSAAFAAKGDASLDGGAG
jgi:hypothetical protein